MADEETRREDEESVTDTRMYSRYWPLVAGEGADYMGRYVMLNYATCSVKHYICGPNGEALNG